MYTVVVSPATTTELTANVVQTTKLPAEGRRGGGGMGQSWSSSAH
jgi:hypothetical protein